MKFQRLIFAAIICLLLIASCKKETNNTGDEEAIFEVYQILDTTRSIFYEFVEANGGNPWIGIVLTSEWLETQPTVQRVFCEDSISIYITLKSGKKTIFGFTEITADGTSKYRGGGKGSQLQKVINSGSCSNKIENKKVLIFAPVFSEFYGGHNAPFMDSTMEILENAEADGFEYTLLKHEQCTPDIVETFSNYGLVLLETHGEKEAFLSGIELSVSTEDGKTIKGSEDLKTFMNAQIGPQYFQWMLEDKVIMVRKEAGNPADPNWWIGKTSLSADIYQIYITAQYIESLPGAPGTVILGNMCHSGQAISGHCGDLAKNEFQHPIKNAFMSLNPLSYYGYAFPSGASKAVDGDFCSANLLKLVRAFIEDGDSTGNAHLDKNGEMLSEPFTHPSVITRCGHFNFIQDGNLTYCFGKCGDSITDARDMQKYATVCIGDQVWMAENLNWAGAGVCYNNITANCDIYGRLYSGTEITGGAYSSANPSGIKGICPDGWHVPSDAEWMELVNFLGGDLLAGGPLKSTSTLWTAPNVGATNSSDFSALPGGYKFNLASAGQEMGQNANFWSCTTPNEPGFPAAYRINNNDTEVNHGEESANLYLSCRCVKD
jgi:uncharacterized protein (TIGR02145 family)